MRMHHCVVALLSAGCVALAGCGGAKPKMQMPSQQVVVVTLKGQPVELTRTLPGRTSAYRIAEVRPQVSGIVKQLLFTEGGRVKAGAPLYELDDAIYRAQYASAKAALERAQTVFNAAHLTATRSQELVKIDAVSTQDNENAVAAEQQAQADVAAAQAALQSAAVNLGYARITSPISGRIGKSSVTQGALVTADQSTALATVQQLDPIYVEVTQSASEWLALRREISSGRVQSRPEGTPVQILLEDGSRYAHDGRVQFADVTVDPTTGSFLIRALVPNPDSTLMPGMYVRAVINEGTATNAVLAPQQGITRDPKGDATALVVDAANKVEQRTVVVTRTMGDKWLVASGLAPGDRLIVEGLQKVQPGATVQAVEQAPEAEAASQPGTAPQSGTMARSASASIPAPTPASTPTASK